MMTGNQIPRIRIEPGRSATDGTDAAMLMEAYAVKLDPWQELVLDAWLGTDATGRYTATSCGLSAARQNGKNCLIEARELFGLVINGERILHTSHQMRTAKKSFYRLVGLFTDKAHPELMAVVKKIRYGVGEESIELSNGGLIEFASRSRQTARGFDGISLVVFDEAQELTDEQIESLMATLSASATGTRQVIYCGTPPYPGCPGEVFKRFREACIEGAESGKRGSACWHEWSLEADNLESVDLSDRALWYSCSPAMGLRLSEDFTAEELASLSAPGFARERLGYWAPPIAAEEAATMELAIPVELWDSCKSDEEKPAKGKTGYGIKFSSDGSTLALAGCIIPNDGKPARIALITIEQTGVGLSWLANWLNQRYATAACVVIDGKVGPDVLVEKISGTWRIKGTVVRPTAQNITAAYSMLINDLTESAVTWYSGQEALRESAITATKRPIGRGGYGFGGELCTAVEACSLALWGTRLAKRNPGKPMRIG